MWVIRDVYWSRIDASPICASLLHGILQVASVRICVHVCEFARMRIKFCTFLSKNTEPYCFHYEKWSHALCIHWICPCRDSRGCCDFNVYTEYSTVRSFVRRRYCRLVFYGHSSDRYVFSFLVFSVSSVYFFSFGQKKCLLILGWIWESKFNKKSCIR